MFAMKYAEQSSFPFIGYERQNKVIPFFLSLPF